ncbi:MAG: hypothetical protein DCC58_03035 [Chloroflexi bacterium]|nr:MAG: hypothetical protein DCC58_03035 [Chloroflexota bacterium]
MVAIPASAHDVAFRCRTLRHRGLGTVAIPACYPPRMSDATCHYIALLRGINVGGATSFPMADLRALASDLGFTSVRTLLQSGNLIFRAAAQPTADLEQQLEAATAARREHHPDYIVRAAAEWQALVAANPFPAAAAADPTRLVVMCLKTVPTDEQVRALQAAISGPETLEVRGREAYIIYPNGQGRSQLTTNVVEKHLVTRATARNWNTVLKIDALLSE